MLSFPPKARKLIILFALYIAQATPMTLFATLLPILLRQQSYSLALIQLVQLIKLPWVLKLFWAPMVDNHARELASIRRWVITSELVFAGLILSLFFLEPNHDAGGLSFPVLLLLLFSSIASSAIQDIAVDKYSILVLSTEEKSLGSGVQSAGAFFGSLLGSGGLVLLYGYCGWETVVFALSALVALALVPLLLLDRDRPRSVPSHRHSSQTIGLRDIFTYVRQLPRRRLMLLLISYASVVGLMGIVKLYLVDLEYNTEDIALRLGIVGSIAAAVSSLGCSVLIRRVGVSWGLRLLYGAGIFLVGLLTYHHVYVSGSSYYIWMSVCLLWAIYGGIMVGVYTLSMLSVRSGREGTDFTLQTTLAQLGALVLSASSGLMVDLMGYVAFFLLEGGLCLLAIYLCRDLDHKHV